MARSPSTTFTSLGLCNHSVVYTQYLSSLTVEASASDKYTLRRDGEICLRYQSNISESNGYSLIECVAKCNREPCCISGVYLDGHCVTYDWYIDEITSGGGTNLSYFQRNKRHHKRTEHINWLVNDEDAMVGKVIATYPGVTFADCRLMCTYTEHCMSVNYTDTCELNDARFGYGTPLLDTNEASYTEWKCV
ncbi:hypothetical protein CAPTEDRAFT_205088 [Capitella teleta]|uniref:Apple domain-containing protein n=1 Tax=Capitella teleta TaxID=283909 RepID=R7TFL6_CAPTE|nr:hypothetical protein CAPTEDRAFT_205088 [Capitella teleta]|eukprot:ELT90306.1 hypothetical protein CAPTEDRAFT_205088 [Capitella teleta]